MKISWDIKKEACNKFSIFRTKCKKSLRFGASDDNVTVTLSKDEFFLVFETGDLYVLMGEMIDGNKSIS